MRFVGEFTVKTLGPGVLNEDQKSRDSIKNEEFTEDSLQWAEVSFKTRNRVRRLLCVHVLDTNSYTLTEVTNYVTT